jgi:XisH protein
MPKRDIYHESVRVALEKEGWQITHDPLNLAIEDTPLLADLGAEAVFVIERLGEQIAVEIKTFGGQSLVTNLHEAVGQYGVYKVALAELYPNWKIYLAVPEPVYNTFFQRRLVQMVLKSQQINIIVYNIQTQTIALWITH